MQTCSLTSKEPVRQPCSHVAMHVVKSLVAAATLLFILSFSYIHYLFCLFHTFIITLIQYLHSYPFSEASILFLHCLHCSEGKTYLGYWAWIWTRACHDVMQLCCPKTAVLDWFHMAMQTEATKLWRHTELELKVHKIENFFGSEFEFCTFSLLVMLKY